MSRQRVYLNDAEKVAAYRKRHQLVTLSVDIPEDVAQALTQYMRFKGLTKAQVITKLLQTQLLRKR